MTEEFECDECGREFDTKRGLSSHKTQAHPEEEESDTSDGAGEHETIDLSLSVRQGMIAVFILGIATGFLGGFLYSGSQLIGVKGDTDTGVDNGEAAGSGETTMEALKSIAESTGVNGDELESCVSSAGTEEISQDRSAITEVAGNLGTPTFFIGNSDIGYVQVSGAQPYSIMKDTIDSQVEDARQGNNQIGDDEYVLENISLDDEPSMGDSSAPINIIEYSDYGCPWCAEWHGVDAIPQRNIDGEESFNQVRTNYVETGKVRFIAKDFPVPQLHPEAPTTHKAANCVYENSPENFWDFSQKLFEERERWMG